MILADPSGVPLVVQPGDFAVLPMGRPGGLVVEAAEWLQETVERRTLGLPVQDYGHAEVYLGDGVTASAYRNRQGIRALGCAPADLPGALWSSGLVPLTGQQRASITQWCCNHAHVQYGSLDYLAITGHALGLDARWLKRFMSRQHSLICSQYVDVAYLQAGVPLFADGRAPGFVTPLALALLLEARRSSV